METDRILILDFGSQYTQLIARRVRESKVYSFILPCHSSFEAIRDFRPGGIILSGGPASVYDSDAPECPAGILELGVPVLGICYGMQWMTSRLKGKVAPAHKREYGKADLLIDDDSDLFNGVGRSTTVWMSHGDRIEAMPEGFKAIAHTANSPVGAMKHASKPFYALQFHPEVAHTPEGMKILQNFLYRICRLQPNWTMRAYIEKAIQEIQRTVDDERAICALSGGVDSAVAATLVHRAIGDRLVCVFVDNGLLRLNEAGQVVETFRKDLKMDLRYVDASAAFLKKLVGVEDPEQKRRIIGRQFIHTFEAEAKTLGHPKFLIQGTLYPDWIESMSFRGPSATIKTHHNVGGLPTKMRFELIEPLRELFKDEVRKLGHELGISDNILHRQPFPGPGLAVRIIGEVNRKRLELLQKADAVVSEEIERAGLYRELWQAFAVLLPVRTVGVMGDERTYENVVAIRAVNSQDGMTADWARIPYDVMESISSRIINEVRGINRVVYDISSKPPSTIEWE